MIFESVCNHTKFREGAMHFQQYNTQCFCHFQISMLAGLANIRFQFSMPNSLKYK
mgnify:CR=1 FL=1